RRLPACRRQTGRTPPPPSGCGEPSACSLACSWRFSFVSQGAVEHRRALHQSDHVEQDSKGAKRERNRDRPRAPPALLLVTQYNSVRLAFHVITVALRLAWRQPRRSAGLQTAQTDTGSRTRTSAWQRDVHAAFPARDAIAAQGRS